MYQSLRATVFDPVCAPSTYEETVTRLGDAIRIGILPPGSRLPPERDLALRLNISRSTLRHALATLTESGHLKALRGRAGGTFVADDPPLSAHMPSPPDGVAALLDFRLAVELGTVQLATERATDEHHERLAECVEHVEALVEGDFPAFRRADAAFHLLLAEVAGSPRLLRSMTWLQARVNDLWHGMPYPEEARAEASRQHAEVAEAVTGRDATAAMVAMRLHLAGTERIVAAALAAATAAAAMVS